MFLRAVDIEGALQTGLRHQIFPTDRHGNVEEQWVYLSLFSAACGGALHGVAMALRKYYGQGHVQYWLEWKWWIGTLADAFAGLLIWPAMPIVSVQLLMPMVVVVQCATSYFIGLCFFREPGTPRSHFGVFCAILGVIGLSLSSSHAATHFTISNFWSQWLMQPVLIATLLAFMAGLACALLGNRSTMWAVCAGFLEGIQFITSRALVDSAFEGLWTSHGVTVLAVFAIKGCCIVGILHTSQLGLEGDLSRFAGIFLIASTIFICLYGSAFYGDHIALTPWFFLSAFATLGGIYLLNDQSQSTDVQHDEEKDN